MTLSNTHITGDNNGLLYSGLSHRTSECAPQITSNFHNSKCGIYYEYSYDFRLQEFITPVYSCLRTPIGITLRRLNS